MWRTLFFLAFAATAWAEPGPQPREVYFDRAGEPLPSGAVLRLGTSGWRSPTSIEQLAFSADEKSILAATLVGVDEYDRTTGRRRALVTFGTDMVGVALAPDGKAVYASGKTGLRRWDVPTGKEIEPWTKRPCHQLGLAPDGALLVVQLFDDEDYDLLVFETRTGKLLRTLANNHPNYAVLALAPNGRRLACAGHQMIRVFDRTTGDVKNDLSFGDGSENAATAIAFTPDSKHLVATGFVGVYWWENGTAEQRYYAEEDRLSWGSGVEVLQRRSHAHDLQQTRAKAL